MKKLKSFFAGILLIATIVAMLFLGALIYRANTQMSVKTYIFQVDSNASQRVGALTNINDMPAVELRNKLIRKYLAEYFMVIPGETNVESRPELQRLSSPEAYEQWRTSEAVTIAQMSKEKKFRRVFNVTDSNIVALNMPENYDYYNTPFAKYILYEVHYYTETWNESNAMAVEPVYEKGTIYIEAKFKPGINEDLDIREYLKSGADPAGMFMFKVAVIKDKEYE